MTEPITLIYILGRGHSGSTLLDLLISSNSQVTSVGEMKSLSSRKRRTGREPTEEPCTCGSARLLDCPFWQRVEAEVRGSIGLPLRDIDQYSDDPEEFRSHAVAVYDAVRRVSGTRFIVDSSKDVERLKKLLQLGVFDIRPIHLTRSPHGVVHSYLREGESWIYQAGMYAYDIARSRHLLSQLDHFCVSYERLVRSPRGVLDELMSWLGLPFEETQLNWPDHEHHNIGGNPMRFSRNCEIRPDTSWKHGLSVLHKAGVSFITLPVHLPNALSYGFLSRLHRARHAWREATGRFPNRSPGRVPGDERPGEGPPPPTQ